VSDQAHASIVKALHILGFADTAIRIIPADRTFRLPVADVEQAVAEDLANGLRPFCVVGNAGNTNTGAVDPLEDLASLCKRYDLWFHIDGAYGAPAILTDEGRALLAGLDRADSLVLDPHKWLFQPFEIGCVLVRDMRLLSDTFAVHPEYLRDVDRDIEEVNFRDYGIQLTRSFRALKLWMSLKAFGLNAFREAVQRGIHLAERAERILRASARWEVVTPAQLGIVTFRYVDAGQSAEEIDHVNERMVERMMDDGFAFLTSTVLRGQVVLRLCTINPRTTDHDVEETIRRLESYASI
jgi:glutamate/tyrosine decarboxylase-like PLP-dependent enzyme